MSDFLRASRIMYTGLFAWLSSRTVFVSTKIVTPVGFLAVLLQIVGQDNDERRFSGYLACASALLVMFGGMFGATSIVRHARAQGILQDASITPRSRIWVFTSVTPLAVIDGLITGLAVLLVADQLTGGAPRTDWTWVVVAFASTAVAAGVLGLAVAQVELLVPRNTGEFTTIVYTVTIILSGAIVLPSQMPGWMAQISRLWPMQNSMVSVRSAYVDGTFSMAPVLRELLIVILFVSVTLTVTESLRRYGRKAGRVVDPWI